MDETANSGPRQHLDGIKAPLHADQLELVTRLDREIDELRRVAPPGHEKTIAQLGEAMLAIHEAIDRLTRTDGR